MNLLNTDQHSTSSLLDKAGLSSNYHQVKANFRLCANEWIGNSKLVHPQDFPNFVENVIRREFQFDNDFMQSLVEEVSKPLELSPHVIVKIDNLEFDNQPKKNKENFNLSLSL